MQSVLCLESHAYFAISLQLDFHSKPWVSKAFSESSLWSYIYAITFREMNILRTLKWLTAATQRLYGKQKFIKFQKFIYR